MLFTYSRVFTPISVIAVCALASIVAASAQTETILHNFTRASGTNPYSGVITDGAGNLYGTTSSGGPANAGAIYKLDSGGHYTVLYAFAGGADGVSPTSGVARDGIGNLYGTTEIGGTKGCGTVYKLDTGGQQTILHTFLCGVDGSFPYGGVTLDGSGSLYGTTLSDGAFASGVVYRIDPGGQKTDLYTFHGLKDGQFPSSNVTLDPSGNLYGTTQYGGARSSGVVYELNPSGAETVLYSFSDGLDGGIPFAGLVRDASGNLYGTTALRGANDYGVVFKIDTSGNYTVLHTFAGAPTDGANPQSRLTFDSSGNLYGTTIAGGAFNNGAIFRIDAVTHQEALIYSFNGVDGSSPNGPLLIAGSDIYGTTYAEGAANYGVLFKLSPAQ